MEFTEPCPLSQPEMLTTVESVEHFLPDTTSPISPIPTSSSVPLFSAPQRGIYTATDLKLFQESSLHAEIIGFIRACGDSITGCDLQNDDISASQTILKLEAFMEMAASWIQEIPPLRQPMRFGNKAFRQWHSRLIVETNLFLENDFLPRELTGASVELAPYLCGSFGNETRIDYGTGHETNLIVFFLALFKIRVLQASDLKALVGRVFRAYITTMRALQESYMLEPAGSHGVWGLDDYHCILFIWGAAQLRNHPEIAPSSIHNLDLLKDMASSFFYLEGISFIRRIKCTAPFAETSPMLNDISYLVDWHKVYNGLLRLYQGEVLGKLPVVQHLVFGTIIRQTWVCSVEGYDSVHATVGETNSVNLSSNSSVSAPVLMGQDSSSIASSSSSSSPSSSSLSAGSSVRVPTATTMPFPATNQALQGTIPRTTANMEAMMATAAPWARTDRALTIGPGLGLGLGVDISRAPNRQYQPQQQQQQHQQQQLQQPSTLPLTDYSAPSDSPHHING